MKERSWLKRANQEKNCDVSTTLQGSKPSVEVTSTSPSKSNQMVSKTVLHLLTPKLKMSRISSIRNMYKVTASGLIRRRMEKNVKVKPKMSSSVSFNTFSRINFKQSGRIL